MSVQGLAQTLVNIYGVSTSEDTYAANQETYTLKYRWVPARLRYLKGREKVQNGKIQNSANYRIYLPFQLDVLESDLVIDINKNRKFDILYVNKLDRKHHLQLDTKRVDDILGEFCPDVIKFISASIVVGVQPFTFNNYSTVEINSTMTKDHFIPTYDGSIVGKTASDRVFYGDQNTDAKMHTSWQAVIINNQTYYIPIYSGDATTGCCADLIGENII